METKRVVIFDGVCNFCNASVNFIMDRDNNKQLMFAANQSEAGRTILMDAGMGDEEVDTVFLYDEGKLYMRSEAVLRIARYLGGGWPLLYGFMIVPRFIRDGVYKWIARNRYKWFGKQESCRLPTPAERARFLA